MLCAVARRPHIFYFYFFYFFHFFCFFGSKIWNRIPGRSQEDGIRKNRFLNFSVFEIDVSPSEIGKWHPRRKVEKLEFFKFSMARTTEWKYQDIII